MKKTIKPMLAVGLFLLLLTNACRKNDLSTTTAAEQAIATTQQDVRPSSSNRSGSSLEPNAMVELSEELFNELNKGRFIVIKRVSKGLYIGEYPAPGPEVLMGDPCEGYWDELDAYIDANRADFEQWANLHCMPYRGTWCHECGLCVMFQVKLTHYIICEAEEDKYHSPLPLHETP